MVGDRHGDDAGESNAWWSTPDEESAEAEPMEGSRVVALLYYEDDTYKTMGARRVKETYG